MGKIGRTNTGGGGLNLRVYASVTQPTNPVENMIWFNTDIAIPHWYFQNDEPSDPEVGDVYITITTTATNILQILRNNGIQLFFGTPRQWDGDSWEIIGGKIYYNGEWHNLQTFVYDGTIGDAEDNFNHSVGGYPWQSARNNATLTKEEDTDSVSFKYSGGTAGSGVWYTPNQIDFSAVNSVKIVYTSPNNVTTARCSVFTDIGSGSEIGIKASVNMPAAAEKTEVTIDTSEVNESCYLGFYAYSNHTSSWSKTYKIYSIELIG